MPFFANTPEALLERTDSKNPLTTCRGITGSGRPCRRTIASAKLPASARFENTTLRVDDSREESLYCFQHKDQASASAQSSPGPRMSNKPILEMDERTSLDTLADRLGLEAEKAKRQKEQRGGRHGGKQKPSKAEQATKMTRPKPVGTVRFCCCFRIPVEEVSPQARPKPRPVQTQMPMTASAPPGYTNGRKSSTQHLSSSQQLPLRTSRPSLSGQTPQQSTTSQTAQYLSLIPPHTSPETASRLMAELAKPISRVDEAGYIYMFWLTPESQPSKPPAEAARSLLAPSTPTRPGRGSRRPSDVMAAFGSLSLDDDNSSSSSTTRGGSSTRSSNKNVEKKKILLKIGRATNVHRRLNEWTRQCGYDLSLIRYYPYIPSASASPSAAPRKVPHSHKVERLIHIELAGLGMRIRDSEKCGACGKEHREWFQVEASRKGVAGVDEVIRRWVEWDEGQE